MSASDELRRMLDERGVKWTRSCYSGMRYLENTKWPIASSNPIKFTEYSDGQTKLIIDNATPEQAIAATLGRGECKVVASSTDGLTSDNPKQWFELSCGHAFKLYGLGAPVACPVCGKVVKHG